MLGYAERDIPDSVDAWPGLIHPEDLGIRRESMTAHLKGQSDSYGAELRVKRKDDSRSWLYLRGSGVRRAGITSGQGVYRDAWRSDRDRKRGR